MEDGINGVKYFKKLHVIGHEENCTETVCIIYFVITLIIINKKKFF